jgi:hypothetical protein
VDPVNDYTQMRQLPTPSDKAARNS